MSLAADSNCRNGLISAEEGTETWMLNRLLEPLLPRIVQESSCVFPLWVQGKWEDVEFRGNEFIFKERGQFHTYRATCISENRPNIRAQIGGLGDEFEEKYHIYARSQW
jgi:hypothetical protein